MAERLRTTADLRAALGHTLGPSSWVTLDQERIDAFAEVTGDRQWIHVDPAGAERGRFGGTIAHGLLTLSLTPALMDELTDLRQANTSVNYGLNRLRFLSPVPAGGRVRLLARILDLRERPPEGVVVTYELTYELEGSARPALVAEALSLLVPRGEAD